MARPDEPNSDPDGSTTPEQPQRERVRYRVRKPVKKGRRRLRGVWLWAPVLGGLLLLVAIAGGLLFRDVMAVRDSLNAARASLEEVRSATGSVDVERATAALARADAELAIARSRSGGPLWSVAARVPVAGDSIEVTREVVAVAGATVDLAERLLADGAELISGGLNVQADAGRVDLAPLLATRDLIDGLPLQRLVDARDRLQRTEPGWAPQEIVDGRRESLEMATETIDMIDNAQQLLAALPGFLGDDGPRRYFLGVQTPAELRGTGGLIGYFAVLSVDDGHFVLEGSEVYEAFDDLEGAAEPVTGNIGQLSGDITQTVEVSEEFAERYDHTAAAGFFSNVNVDPDLPTTAEVALDLFEARIGDRLDGMILVDPIAMEKVLTAVGGDITVPAELAGAADVPESLSAQQFAEYVTVDIYDQLGYGNSRERKLVLRGLGDMAFARVFDGAWEGVAVSRAVGDAASERHIQVYSRDEAEQAAFGRIGATGELVAPDGADLLAVTANNAVGGKQDVHLGHLVTGQVQLSDPRRSAEGEVTVARSTAVRVEVDNPLPSSGMDTYVIGNCLVGGDGNQCFDGPPGDNRTWFTVWSPAGSMLQAASGDDGRAGVGQGRMRDLQAYDRYLETGSESSAGFDLEYRGRAPAATVGDDLVYELAWWAQSKAIPTLLDLAVSAPDGWQVASVEVVGGGSGLGFGVHGDGRPLTGVVDDQGRARLVGTATADTRLVVHMTGADPDD